MLSRKALSDQLEKKGECGSEPQVSCSHSDIRKSSSLATMLFDKRCPLISPGQGFGEKKSQQCSETLGNAFNHVHFCCVPPIKNVLRACFLASAFYFCGSPTNGGLLMSVGSGDPELGLFFGQRFAKGVVSTARAGDHAGDGESELGSQLDLSSLESTWKDLLIHCSWSIENIFKYPWVLV